MSSKHFPKSEYDRRWAQAREEMGKRGMDALVVTDTQDYIYLSGHSDRATLTGKARPYVFILPMNHDPVLVIRVHQLNEARQNTWIEDIRTWSKLPFTVDPVTKTMADLGLDKGKVGAEMGSESRLGMSYGDFMKMQRDLPNVEFVDASTILRNMRMVKSSGEIEHVSKACEITSRAIERAFDEVKDGMTEREAIRILYDEMMSQGADMPGPAKTRRPVNFDRELRNGEFLRFDTCCVRNCYWSDEARLTVVGKASEAQKRLHSFMWDLTQSTIDQIKPGVAVSSIVKFFNDKVGKGLPPYVPKLKAKDRLGHGVGLEPTEPPSVALEDDTILEPGMVIAMEPVVIPTEEATLHVEECGVVTENGYKILTNATREL